MKKVLSIVLILLVASSIFAQSNRKMVGVATFGVSGNAVPQDEAEAITDLFITELFSMGNVTVLDRVSFEAVLRQQNFQDADWFNATRTKRLGTTVGADVFVQGKILKLGTKFYLSANIIDAATAVVLSSSRIELSSMDVIFDMLTDFCAVLLEPISGTLKIGDLGPGGGLIFYVEGNMYYEVSPAFDMANWANAKSMAENYRGNGFNDWRLPTKDELNYVYMNLRAKNIIGDTGSLWSSTEYSGSFAWGQSFLTGEQYYHFYKVRSFGVRAIRSFTL